jgi:Secretion system C-terminal sorting domain
MLHLALIRYIFLVFYTCNHPTLIMRKRRRNGYVIHTACLLSMLFLFCFPSFSQTTNISGIVNSYYQVIEVIPAKAAVRLSSVSGISPHSHAMIIQMKGATINTSNTASFGDTTSLNGAGDYEIGIICAVIDDTVFMVHDLLNTYDISSKVQLVQFGEYVSANITDTLKATPWNNATGTGGVIALFVEDTLTFNAPVYATASGYSGGAFVLSNGTCSNGITNYYYPGASTNPQNGAYKGEGVADVATSQNGGRGAPTNGGGGGNNHNNSGGGGANLNAGGLGGGNSSASGCNASANQKGIGGKPLSSWGGRKIFLGGGGGAGHNNNGVFTLGGANGGGIIFIHTDTLIGNNYTIAANGGKGGNSQADGAGGGGGGGTIIMDVNKYIGNVTIAANGGDGGNSNDALNINNCRGGGGGGSGGVVYFTGTLPAITVTADLGAAGLETSRDNASCGTIQPASPGTNGQIIPNYAYQSSSVLAGYCAWILPVSLTSFRANLIEKKIALSWEVAGAESIDRFVVERMITGRGWMEIISVEANERKTDYNATDNNPAEGYNLYRLKVIEKNNVFSYSSIRQIFLRDNKNIFTIYPNPATDRITITSDFSSVVEMKLSDVSGKILFTRKLLGGRIEINLPPLASGVYFLHINQTVRKLIVQ